MQRKRLPKLPNLITEGRVQIGFRYLPGVPSLPNKAQGPTIPGAVQILGAVRVLPTNEEGEIINVPSGVDRYEFRIADGDGSYYEDSVPIPVATLAVSLPVTGEILHRGLPRYTLEKIAGKLGDRLTDSALLHDPLVP